MDKSKLRVDAKTEGQQEYIRTILDNKITLCAGPAGSGKTFIASSLAIIGLLKEKYEKVVITRPMVQAGESTGYLPGSVLEKMEPMLLPIYDELEKYITRSDITKLIKSKQLEICPLALMRGRNFHNAFIVADECQNATYKQIMLLLTRFGQNSKMVLTGDETQSDLSGYAQGGFQDFIDGLGGVKDVGITQLTTSDIVREPIVGDIIIAMKEFEENANKIPSYGK